MINSFGVICWPIENSFTQLEQGIIDVTLMKRRHVRYF